MSVNVACYDENLKYYFKDLGNNNYDPITIEEEKILFGKIKNGCERSKNRIIESNLRFVVQTALYYAKKYNVSSSELISEGNLGLIHAMSKFDVDRDIKFISYAGWWVKQHILFYIDNGMSYDYVDVDLLVQKMENFEEESEYDMEFSSELADSQYLSKEESDNRTIIISNLLSLLSDREETIIKYYYGIDNYCEMNLDEIGEAMNLTKERVRQIKKTAISKLKSSILLLDDFNNIYKL